MHLIGFLNFKSLFQKHLEKKWTFAQPFSLYFRINFEHSERVNLLEWRFVYQQQMFLLLIWQLNWIKKLPTKTLSKKWKSTLRNWLINSNFAIALIISATLEANCWVYLACVFYITNLRCIVLNNTRFQINTILYE